MFNILSNACRQKIKLLFRIVIIFSCFSFLSIAHSENNNSATESTSGAAEKHILVFGDSLSAAYGIELE